MESKSGYVSINTENIFPIIKKWLYSEKDIFLREIVSNASDAISKMKKLISIGEADLPEEECKWRIEVSLDKEAGTITVYDNGIGMTEEEVFKYINQIAFSGVKDFIEKYEGKTDESKIIGHFGLGFYSSFMVCTKVEIDTKSWVEGSESVHWESTTGMDYSITPSDIDERGTYITMHLAEDSKEYLDEFKIKETLQKYFSFLPVDLYFINAGEDLEEDEDKEEVIEVDEDGTQTKEEVELKVPKTINDPEPLWLKAPKDCTDEEYKAFYQKVFMDFNEPLFWIHLNMDYPFNLKGILYFPKLKNQYEDLQGTIKIYYNQVFVADNIKEMIPEFLMLLNGVIDSPDLPLNVSRSFLQNDGYVDKISAHITKKVADKINGLFKTERESFEKYWKDINPFVKFGCLKDEKFYDRVKDSIIYKSTDNKYVTEVEHLEDVKDKEKIIYYVDNEAQQSQYIKMFKESEIPVFVMDGPIDTPFMQLVEYKGKNNVKFVRVDSDVANVLKSETDESTKEELDKIGESLKDQFVTVSSNEKLQVKVENLKSDIPAILVLSEEGRRMQEMMKMYGNLGFPMGEDDVTLVLNNSNPVISHLNSIKDDVSKEEDVKLLCGHIYDLALLAHKPLGAEDMTRFIERSSRILSMISEK